MKAGNTNGRAKQNGVRIGLVAGLLLAWGTVSPAAAQTVAAVTVPTPAPAKSWAKKVFGRPDWIEVAHAYESPKAICRLVENEIRYKTEDVDAWSQAEETWTRGRGDCEDFALLIQSLCLQSGIPTKVHLYFPSTGGREGHAVLVGEWNGKVWFSSNGSYEEVKSEQDVRARVARMLSCKEKNLWAMKLNETDVARYLQKTPAQPVASR